MVDHISPEKRSWNMSRIRSKNTKPEKIVRSLLHRLGFRFRIHKNNLLGKPDIVLKKYNTVLFVHGCFWHQHKGCSRCFTPKDNINYWKPKLERNVSKFVEDKKNLKKLGWNVVVIWECETKNPENLKRKIQNLFYRI